MCGFFVKLKVKKIMCKTDLHLHTTASDGSDTPSELLALAREAGLTVISITDHDTLAGCIEAIKAPRNDVKVITGIEFSCHHYGECDFDCHILGYGFDPCVNELLSAIAHGRELRLMKLEARLKYLDSHHGIKFDEDEIRWLHSLNSVAKPHLARLIVKRGLADSISDAIHKYLKGEKFPDDRIDAKEAIEAIIAAGGIPVYAHPLGGETEKRLTKEEVEPRINSLKEIGVMGLECYYSRYSSCDESLLLSLAENHGLLVSAGSDYHGKNKTVVLGDLSIDANVSYDKITILSHLLNR